MTPAPGTRLGPYKRFFPPSALAAWVRCGRRETPASIGSSRSSRVTAVSASASNVRLGPSPRSTILMSVRFTTSAPTISSWSALRSRKICCVRLPSSTSTSGQTDRSSSSFVTTRSRFSMRITSVSNALDVNGNRCAAGEEETHLRHHLEPLELSHRRSRARADRTCSRVRARPCRS